MERKCHQCGAVLSRYNPGALCRPCQESRAEETGADHLNYDVEDMRKLLGLQSQEQVRRLARKGRLPPSIPEIRKKLWSKEDIDAWLKSEHEVPLEAGRFSSAQLIHFAGVKGYVALFQTKLGTRRLEDMVHHLARDHPTDYLVYRVEEEPFFPILRGHLAEPVVEKGFWKLWAVIKAEQLLADLKRLWQEMRNEAQKQAKPGFAMESEPAIPKDGLTSDFLVTIWWEQLGVPSMKEAEYHEGSVSYLEDSIIWASVEEGEARINGRKFNDSVPTAFVFGTNGVTSPDARIIEKVSPPVKERQSVRFFVRFGHLELAFLPSPDGLAMVRQAHEKMREEYPRKIKRMMKEEDVLRRSLENFKEKLARAALFDVFPGNCPYCPH